MHKRRLLKLADLLEADAKKKRGIQFDLGTWAMPTDTGPYCHYIEKQNDVPVNCQTTACAMGLAAISGAFKREGLTFSFQRRQLFGDYVLVPKLGRRKSFSAAAALFDISNKAAEFLFSALHYRDSQTTGAGGERAVAKRIRAFVAGKASP